jgi:hypothetical protein
MGSRLPDLQTVDNAELLQENDAPAYETSRGDVDAAIQNEYTFGSRGYGAR